MEETINLLQTWNTPQDIVNNFIENGITIEHFKDLTDTYLKELCPHMGLRIKLKNDIQDLLDSAATTEAYSESTATSNNPCSTAKSNNDTEVHCDEVMEDIQIPSDLTNFLNDIIRPPLPDFDIKTLLQTSAHGSSVLNYYTRYKNLNAKKRNILVDIIIKHIYTYIVNNKLTPEEYNLISAKVVTLFPSENTASYYMKAVPTAKSTGGKYIPAKGKLVDKVRNLLYISGEKHRTVHTKQNTEPENDKENNLLDDDDVLWLKNDDDVLWWKNNTDPWDDVISRWKKTFRLRIGHTNSSTVHDFLENWSILKTDKGHVLINSDFEELFKDKALNFHKNWHDFFEKLLIVKKGQVNNKNALSLIETLSAITDEDKKIPVQMSILAYLIPPKGRLSRSVKYSSAEATEGLIVQTDIAGDIDKTITEQKSKNLARNLSVQPYILLQGSLHNFTRLYMVIDDIKYVFDCASKAFDLLFKIYHVFHVRYPNASEYLYLTIQRKVYGIVTKYDRVPPHIVEILNMK